MKKRNRIISFLSILTLLIVTPVNALAFDAKTESFSDTAMTFSKDKSQDENVKPQEVVEENNEASVEDTENEETDTEVNSMDKDAQEASKKLEPAYIFESKEGNITHVFIAIGEDGDELKRATLSYRAADQIKEIAGEVKGNVAVFNVEGEYTLLKLSGLINSEAFSSDLTILQNNEEIQVSSDEGKPDISQQEQAEKFVVDATADSSLDLKETLSKSAEEIRGNIKLNSSNGVPIIVIDPGHSPHTGCTYNYDGIQYYEDDFTFKIATYLKAILESGGNCQVYLTRTYNENPSLAQRVQFAANLNADIMVSCHLNASGSRSANGLMAMTARIGSFNVDNAQKGQNLANIILNKLMELGFGQNYGLSMPVIDDGSTYPDGSLCDYYGIVRHGQELNVPAIIIEHGFLSNESDFRNFLCSDDKLYNLALKDAEGIRQYLNIGSGFTGWKNENGNTYYYINGEYQTGTPVIDGKKYFFDQNGILQFGWQSFGGWQFYCDPLNGGAMAKGGAASIENKLYLFDNNGVLITSPGMPILNGYKYYVNYDKTLITGWVPCGNSKLYFSESTGAALTGIGQVGYDFYYFDVNGLVAPNTQFVVAGKKYCSDSYGKLIKGWQIMGPWTFYYDPNSHIAATGVRKIDGKLYLFDDNGALYKNTGHQLYRNKKYNVGNGYVLVTGWVPCGTSKLYFSESTGEALTGIGQVGYNFYYFDVNGLVTPNTQFVVAGKKYCSDNYGKLIKGWQVMGQWTFYYDPNSHVATTGVRNIDGKLYLFDDNGALYKNTGHQFYHDKKYSVGNGYALVTGWIPFGNSKLYFDTLTGECAVGIKSISGNSYYFDINGIMVKNAQIVDENKKYYISENGTIQKGWFYIAPNWLVYGDPADNGAFTIGWKTIDDKKYCFDNNGIAYMGFSSIDGHIFYIDWENGVNVGTPIINGKKYFFNEDGYQQFGWQTLAEWTIYCNPKDNGAMVTTYIEIDNVLYRFNSDGVLIESNVASVEATDPISGRKYTLEGTYITDPQIGKDITEDEFFAAAVYTEAGGQGMPGQIAVALVMLNRVYNESYGNSLAFVIYQKTHFEVARNGALTKALIAFRDKDYDHYLKYVEKSQTMEAVRQAKEIMYNHLTYGTPRQIEGISSEYGVPDFACLYFMTPDAFYNRQHMDPVKCEIFQYKNTIFFNKYIKA